MVLVLIYAVFSLLIVRFCMVLFNFTSHPKLPGAPRNYYDFVSFLIPSYVDLTQLTGLVQSIREQEFENYEVLIYGNGAPELRRLVKMASGNDSRFRIVQPLRPYGGGPPPEQTLAAQAGGDYFVFLKDLERIEPGLVYSAIYRMKLHSLALLSLFPEQKMKTFVEGQLVPLKNYLLVSLLPLRLVLLSPWKWLVASNDQCLLFDAKHYRSFKWHSGTGSDTPRGPEIMKTMKALGFRVESLFANRYVSGRMYTGERSFLDFQGDLISDFGGSAMALGAYLLFSYLGMIFLIPVLNMQLIGMALTLLVGMRILSSLLNKQPVWWNVLFHPLQMTLLAAAIGASLFRIVRKNP